MAHLSMWREALKNVGEETGKYTVPKKGSSEYDRVMAVYAALKNPNTEPEKKTRKKRETKLKCDCKCKGEGVKLGGEGVKLGGEGKMQTEGVRLAGDGIRLAGEMIDTLEKTRKKRTPKNTVV